MGSLSLFWEQLASLPSVTAIRKFLASTDWSRAGLLDFLQLNDPDGCWDDEHAEAEEMEPATKQDAIDAIVEIVRDSIWDADDPRRR